MGKLNKDGSAIKTWQPFLSGIGKKQNDSLTASQEQLNALCLQLLKIIEKQPGSIAQTLAAEKGLAGLSAIFSAWQAMLPVLRHQPFVYAYTLYGAKELKGAPAKDRTRKIELSDQQPLLRFVLTETRTLYRLQLQVVVAGGDTDHGKMKGWPVRTPTTEKENHQPLPEYDAGATLFITDNSTFYLLSCLRDAALAEWMHRCGGSLTIFKQQFEQFEKEILIPLQEHYPVERKKER